MILILKYIYNIFDKCDSSSNINLALDCLLIYSLAEGCPDYFFQFLSLFLSTESPLLILTSLKILYCSNNPPFDFYEILVSLFQNSQANPVVIFCARCFIKFSFIWGIDQTILPILINQHGHHSVNADSEIAIAIFFFAQNCPNLFLENLICQYISIPSMSLICLKFIISILQKESQQREKLLEHKDEWLSIVEEYTSTGTDDEISFSRLVVDILSENSLVE